MVTIVIPIPVKTEASVKKDLKDQFANAEVSQATIAP
jgi:hypothetical protein